MEDTRGPHEPAYTFDQRDADQFRHSRDVLADLNRRRDSVTSMRQAVLALYFQYSGGEEQL